MGKLRPRCTQRGNLGTYPLEEVLGRVLLMPALAGFRSYARWPCSSPREKLGPVPVTTGAGEGDGSHEGEGAVLWPQVTNPTLEMEGPRAGTLTPRHLDQLSDTEHA